MAKGMSKPFAVLEMTGVIRAGVSFAPRTLDFGAASARARVTRVVTVTVDKAEVRAGESLRLRPLAPEVDVASDVPATPMGQGAAYLTARRFMVRLSPKARLGLMNEQMQLEAVDAKGAARKLGEPMSVFGQVIGSVQANPEVLAFGVVNKGEPQTRVVTVQGIKAADLAAVKIVCSSPALKAEIQAAPVGLPDDYAQLSVTMSGAAPLGGFQGEVTVVTPKGEQLVLPAYAQVQEAVAGKS